MMAIHQFLTSYSYGDAIGNEAMEIRNYLRDQGYESSIFVLYYHPKYSGQVINYLEYDRYSSAENIVIYHFSIGSKITKKFLRIPDKKVIIYHNITPHHFFLDYHRILAKDCFKGRVELRSLSDKVDLALGDSAYNESELIDAGFSRTGVLPLVMNFEKFNSPVIPAFDTLFRDGKTNILYVGRIIPNKKVEDVIRTYHIYNRFFNKDSRLFIVGEHRGFERYYSALINMADRLKVRNLHFTGHIPEDELISYFKLADVYLHMSEHEGFCAPVPEAFFLDIPVIAYNEGAVKETMNGGGLLINRKAFLQSAALIDKVVTDRQTRDRILDSQRKSLEKYKRNRTGKILLDHLDQIGTG